MRKDLSCRGENKENKARARHVNKNIVTRKFMPQVIISNNNHTTL